MRLISVVLGTKSPSARANESQALLNYGFRFFETRMLWDENEVIENVRVWKGAEEATSLIVTEPVYATIPRGAFDSIEIETSVPAQIIAPVVPSDALGIISARIGEETVASANLYSSTSIDEGSLVQIAWDEVLLWFE